MPDEPEPTDAEIVWVEPELIDLIPEFLENRRSDLKTMQFLAYQMDFQSLSKQGHKLKGMAPSFGFRRLGELGEALECAADKEDAQKVAQIVDLIASAIVNPIIKVKD